jgi:Domain of unknown function (DUF4450)/Mannosylglycerate hydrolase MGH1-like glycoside hydrolase domain
MTPFIFLGLAAVSGVNDAARDTSSSTPLNCYHPVEGGWRIVLTEDEARPTPESPSAMGVPQDNPRQHRRPLYPPADRTMLWNEEQLTALERCGFRPLVLAYNAPHFLFDYHSAGGLLGHLYLGLRGEDGAKWLHEWSYLDVSYVDGRMEYVVRDPAFPGVTVSLSATPLAASAGLIARAAVEGGEGLHLVWAYGGASAFFTNYAMTAPEFTFAPGQCAKDRVSWAGRRFSLRRAFDESDVYMNEVFAAARYLPDWEAVIHGGSSWDGPVGFGDPPEFIISPQGLCESATWVDTPEERRNCVAVQSARLGQDRTQGYIVIGMGGDIAQALDNPEEAWRAAEARNRAIAARITTRTPDPHLDAAVRMMAFATEGSWGDLAILHGAWSWRFAYLGWRGWYGSTCYGWTGRVRQSIENHTRLGLVREGADAGALGALLEHEPGVYYNMNEVFMDQVRHYFEYTNDIDLMRRIFPVLQGILEWEDRRLQPGGKHLYENSLNTWISDSHWYIGGQCTQASAYMLGANTFLAGLAERLGEDPAPYRTRAGRIRAAMQENLWMPDEGVFAEYLDTRGHRMLHPQPELPTLYHAAEFAAADAGQIAQMLRWADTHLETEQTPGGGALVWSSNWAPNNARSYTHSTHELTYAEALNFALTNYLAGRADEAYALIRATLCGVFNGPTPGGLACHTYVDGRQRANDEFTDAISMWGRTVSEGLFGIVPRRPEGRAILSPQFPRDWRHAEIATPAFSYEWTRDAQGVCIEWSSPLETEVSLRLPIRAAEADEVLIDGQPVEATTEKGFAGVNWVIAATPPSRAGRIAVRYTEARVQPTTRQPAPQRTGAEREQWSPPDVKPKDLAAWTLVDMNGLFNASVTEVLQRIAEGAEPPPSPASQVGFTYWRDHLQQYHGSRNQPISDAAWRAKVDESGAAWTTDGIPFQSAKEGPNIAVVTLSGGFPHQVTLPVDASGAMLYLMLSGMTFPVQSHVANLRITLRYSDGGEQQTDLVNPFDIGDCWSTWCGRYHDTAANGFENIGGRSGPMGSSEVDDLTKPVALDTEAHLVPFSLRTDAKLASVTVEAVANDVIFGIMGATVLK